MGGEADVVGAIGRHVRLVLKNRLRPRSGGVTPEVLRDLQDAFVKDRPDLGPAKKEYSSPRDFAPAGADEKYIDGIEG
jgi:hypothetical protein